MKTAKTGMRSTPPFSLPGTCMQVVLEQIVYKFYPDEFSVQCFHHVGVWRQDCSNRQSLKLSANEDLQGMYLIAPLCIAWDFPDIIIVHSYPDFAWGTPD